VVAAWTDAPEVEQLRVVRRLGLEAERERPNATAYLNGIVRGGNRFPAEVRAEMEVNARDANLFTRGVAHVVLLPGWLGSTARAIARGAIAVGRPPVTNLVFAAAPPAAKWLAERLGEPWTADRVMRAWAVAHDG
jgi:hypothetical protein